MSSIYVISTVSGMKQYQEYALENYKEVLNDLYKRNSLIIKNKEVLIKNMPKINKNVENIEKLVDKEKKDMNINDGIDLSNEIEQNVITIINEYKKSNDLNNNEEIKNIMEKIMELNQYCLGSQEIFNLSTNDKETGYNGIYSKNIVNTQIAKIFGFTKINEFKSK